MDNEKQFTINFNGTDLDLVLRALSELPYKISSDAINKIVSQLQEANKIALDN